MHRSPALTLLIRQLLTNNTRSRVRLHSHPCKTKVLSLDPTLISSKNLPHSFKCINTQNPIKFDNDPVSNSRPYDVFINHRSIDTKRSIAALLYDHLVRLQVRPFLDNKNMKPGDKLFEKINAAIKDCKIGVAVFSPHYCESYFCLHELALLVESKKKVIPIFCDVKPSELRVLDNGSVPLEEVTRFKVALEEAKYTVGLTFDSSKGNWSEVLTDAANIVMDSLREGYDEQGMRHKKYQKKSLPET